MKNKIADSRPFALEKISGWKGTFNGIAMILIYPLLLLSIILIIINGPLYFISDFSRTFTANLINQTVIQDLKGDYIVYQNFSFQPFPLMKCNSHSRTMTLNYVPAIEDVYYLDLTAYCQEGKIYPYQELWITLIVSLCLLYTFYIYLKFFSHEKNINLFLHCLEGASLILLVSIFLFQIGLVIADKQSLLNDGHLAKVDIISENYFISPTFQYCHRLTVNITNNLITCYNQNYVGECYQKYEETFEASSNGEIYLDNNCDIQYFSENKQINSFSFIFHLPLIIYFSLAACF